VFGTGSQPAFSGDHYGGVDDGGGVAAAAALHVQVQDLAFVLSLLRRLFYMSSSIVYPRFMSLRYCSRCISAAGMFMSACFDSLSVLKNAPPSHPTTT
jgi:hypothetical protein